MSCNRQASERRSPFFYPQPTRTVISKHADNRRIWQKQQLLVLLALLAFMSILGLRTGLAAEPEIYLTKGDKNDQPGTVPQQEFHCSDTIMAVIEGKWPTNSEHTLDVYWINPQGEQQEHSRQAFTSYGSTRVWVWLRLHAGERNLLDKLLMEEDTSLQEFVGQWKVDFYLDGKKLARRRFKVSC